MRIIAGRLRRRRLLTRTGLVTRPITDRVKETLFARLEDSLPGARVADVFAGTGTLGLEALSRGAHSVVFIEQDREASELLKRNVETLGVAEAVLCWQTDAVRSSYRPQGVDDFLPYDLIFFDPPYRMVPTLQPGTPLFRALQRLARPDVSTESAQLVLRVPERAEFAMPPVWTPHWSLEISSMELHVYTRTPT
jgi:16S rRNA (guanine966-N2)-methyltransferase